MSFDQSDRNFVEIRRRINQYEEAVAGLMLERELSAAAADLISMPGWKIVRDKIGSLGERQVGRLKSEELEPYWLGRAQGYLRAMDVMLALRRLSPEELAQIEEQVSLCTEKIAELRNLLD
ncbi:MAG: hypothetical protein KBA95_19625 [Acidobacteria bacterium]|nr:hypothetical protein [Acidobacteriota bacterium]